MTLFLPGEKAPFHKFISEQDLDPDLNPGQNPLDTVSCILGVS